MLFGREYENEGKKLINYLNTDNAEYFDTHLLSLCIFILVILVQRYIL